MKLKDYLNRHHERVLSYDIVSDQKQQNHGRLVNHATIIPDRYNSHISKLKHLKPKL